MRYFLTALILIQPSMALAHLGHVADAAGHNHWIGVIAIGVAVGAAVWGGLAGKGADEVENSEDGEEPSEEPVEA